MKENKNLEYKEKITNTFLKTVSAYANYGDGVIKFGITDEGELIGIENTEAVCLDIENKINDSLSPVPDYDLEIDSKTNVITLKVMEGQFKPYYYKSKAYKRNDTATIEVDRVELSRLILEGENRSFDEVEISDDLFSFNVLEKKCKEILGITSINSDILRTFGLVNKNGKYSKAGNLLADENNFKGIDCARFGDSIDIILDREKFEGCSILKMYDDAVNLYRKYYQYDEIKSAVRTTIELIPEKAFRETIANALVHRSWDVDVSIRIAMYEDKIEVYTPGGLPSGINQDEYLNGQISVLRNPIIAGVFYRLNIIESFGTGIQRIQAAYCNSNVKPSHVFSENAIKVVLPVISSSDALEGAEKIVYKVLTKFGKSSSQIAEEVGYGKNKTIKILAELEQKGYVLKIGNGRGTKYIIKW